MIRDCEGFDAWLDGGREDSLAGAARAHAALCARCAGSLELEELLSEPPAVRAGAAFTENVLFRVRDADRARAASQLVLAEELPWWLRAPAEPSAALALALAALLAWRGDGLWAFSVSLALRARAHDWTHGPGSGALEHIGNPFAGLPGGTLASGALLCVMLAVVGTASWALYRAMERLLVKRVSHPVKAHTRGLPHAR